MIYFSTWRYGFQFDVQRDRQADGSFRGHLWTWDYRRPFTLIKD